MWGLYFLQSQCCLRGLGYLKIYSHTTVIYDKSVNKETECFRKIMEPDHTQSPEWLEHTERAKAWFENPEKNRIRTAAKRVIKKRIEDVVIPAGFSPTERGTGWELKKRLVTRGIYVQASRGGDRCYFNIAKQFKFRWVNTSEVKRLSHFYDTEYDRVGDKGSLFYYDVEQFPRYVDQVVNVIEREVIPWLLK